MRLQTYITRAMSKLICTYKNSKSLFSDVLANLLLPLVADSGRGDNQCSTGRNRRLKYNKQIL